MIDGMTDKQLETLLSLHERVEDIVNTVQVKEGDLAYALIDLQIFRHRMAREYDQLEKSKMLRA